MILRVITTMRICDARSSLPPIFLLLFLFLFIAIFQNSDYNGFVKAGKRRIEITDDLDDVIDDEEDEFWKEWGKKKSASTDSDIPPPDFSKMQFSEIQDQIMKQQSSGPAMGFVKLRLGVRRKPDEVAEIAMKWTKVLKTGSIEAKFMGVDLSTIMFTMERGQDVDEVKEFVLSQPESYEIKVGDQVFRRPGDPPLEEVVEMLQRDKNKADTTNPSENVKHSHEEL